MYELYEVSRAGTLDGEVIYGRCWLDRRTAALHTKLVLVLETELER